VVQSLAQGYYPLQIGNIWQYHSSDPTDPTILDSRIVGDTILPNGKSYFMMTGFTLGSSFLRQDSSTVFAYDVSDSSEYKLFDFSASPHDTISKHSSGNRTVVLNVKSYDTTNKTWTWAFMELQGQCPSCYDFYNWFIQDSIGLVSMIVEPGNSYYLIASKINGKVKGIILSVSNSNSNLPTESRLYQNYPNPFNSMTNFRFYLPATQKVEISLYDLLGRRVSIITNSVFDPGNHTIQWNAGSLATGVYWYQFRTQNMVKTLSLIYLK
jgi:Secretion system C-terminal sorting domain